MSTVSICRIGIFYDGTYFIKACRYFYHDRGIGWLQFKPFHELIENYMREKEPNYTHHYVVYAAWFQGIYSPNQAAPEHLLKDRRLHDELMRAGIEPKFTTMSQPEPTEDEPKEKGVDVSLAIDAIQLALDRKIDVAVLVTGDGDFVPLARALTKHAITVTAAHFNHFDGQQPAYASQRLLAACKYNVNINDIERHHKSLFEGLFKQMDGQTPNQTQASNSHNPPAPSGVKTPSASRLSA